MDADGAHGADGPGFVCCACAALALPDPRHAVLAWSTPAMLALPAPIILARPAPAILACPAPVILAQPTPAILACPAPLAQATRCRP